MYRLAKTHVKVKLYQSYFALVCSYNLLVFYLNVLKAKNRKSLIVLILSDKDFILISSYLGILKSYESLYYCST